MSRTTLVRRLAYLEAALARTTDPRRRADLEVRAEALRAQLVGRCRRCGRRLSDPASLAAGVGPDCAAMSDHDRIRPEGGGTPSAA